MGRCSFPSAAKGSACIVCGYALRRDYDCPPRRDCDNPRPPIDSCKHFLEWTDRTALSTCGCKSIEKLGTPTTIAECGLHGDVTPLAKKTKEGLPSCLGCPDFRQ